MSRYLSTNVIAAIAICIGGAVSPRADDQGANKSGKTVDMSSIYNEVATQNKSQGDAKALASVLKDLDYPRSILRAQVMSEKPQVLGKTERAATLRWLIEVSIDKDAYYDKVCPKIQSALDAAAKGSAPSEGVLTGRKTGEQNMQVRLGLAGSPQAVLVDPCTDFVDGRTSNMWSNQLGFGKGKGLFGLITRSNSTGDSLQTKWYRFDENTYAVLLGQICVNPRPGQQNREFRGQTLPFLQICWINEKGDALIKDEMPLAGPAAQLCPSYGLYGPAGNRYGTSDGVLVGPFVFANNANKALYADKLDIIYTRDVGLDELKQVTQMKCNFINPAGR